MDFEIYSGFDQLLYFILYYNLRRLVMITLTINQYLLTLSRCLIINKLKLNINKTKSIIIASKRNQY